MTHPRYLGLDIGGANLKAATNDGWSESIPFPLWKAPERLVDKLTELLHLAPPFESVAVTMTGELADCFSTKRAGVTFIVDAVTEAVSHHIDALDTSGTSLLNFYLTGGRWGDAMTAKINWQTAAASNWHAMASWLARLCQQRLGISTGILVDLGSTTCDVIPFSQGVVSSIGHDDRSRMFAGELVYTGVGRSPVCAVLPTVQLQGQDVPIAQELFATMRDVYVLLEEMGEEQHDLDTADGRPRTLPCSTQRMARLLCSDAEELDSDCLIALAQQAKSAQGRMILAGLQKVVDHHQQQQISRGANANEPGMWCVSGEGEFILRELLGQLPMTWPIISVAELFGRGVSRCGPAFAIANLLAEKASV